MIPEHHASTDAPEEIVPRPSKLPLKNVSVNSGPKRGRPTSLNERTRERIPAGRGKGTTSGSTPISKNVFAPVATRSIVKRRPTLLENSADPTKQTKHFTKLRYVRKAELAGRDKDVAPDVTALGGLFKPGEIPKMHPVTVSDVRAPPVNLFDRREFRPEDDDTNIEPSTSSRHEKSTVLPGTGKLICYFWNLNKGADYACSKGILCRYLHENVPGATLADPPSEHSRDPKHFDVVPQNSSETTTSINTGVQQPDQYSSMDIEGRPSNQAFDRTNVIEERTKGTYSVICWYWYRDGSCVKSSTCDFLHTNDPQYSIASRPIKDRLPEKSQPLRCPYWVKHGWCKKNNNCDFLHSSDSSIPVVKKPKTCRFWNSGYCQYSASDCEYLHGEPLSAKAPSKADFEVRTSDDNINNPANPSSRKSAAPSTEQPPAPKKSASFGTEQQLAPKKAVSFGTEQQLAPKKSVSFGPTESTTFFEEHEIRREDSPISYEALEPIASPPKVLKKVSMDEYRRKGAQKVLKERTKLVSFGSRGNQQAVPLDVGEMGPDTNWRRAFAAICDIRLDLQCSHDDISTQFQIGTHRILWEGSLMPTNAEDSTASTIVDNVATHMKLFCCGLLASLPEFNILVFPNTAEEWDFLAGTSFPGDHKLKYILFKSDFDISSCNYSQTNMPSMPASLHRDAYTKTLVEEVHGLSIDRFGSHGKDESSMKFYLMFPTDAKKTCHFVAKFLAATFPTCRLFSSDIDGSWKSFAMRQSGTIIVHASMVAEMDELPYLNTMLRSHSRIFQFFYATDSSIKHFMFPSLSSPLSTYDRYLGGDETENPNFGKVVVERLFPHGGIIFLTPSFLAAEPERTLDILYWFFGKMPGKGKFEIGTPGTWKLATCWDFSGYMHDLAIAKSEERDRFLIENHENPAKDAIAAERGLGYESCSKRFKIHEFLTEVFAREGVLNTVPQGISFYTKNTADEYKEPVVYFGQPWTEVDLDDETKLSEMFAAWAFSRMDSFRRFIMMGTGPQSTLKATRLKSASPGVECVQQSNLDTTPSKWSSTAKSHPLVCINATSSTAESGMTPQKQKALAVAARIGQSSARGPTVNKNSSGEGASLTGTVSRSSKSNGADDLMNIDAQILQLIESSRSSNPPLRIVTSGAANGVLGPTSSTGSALTGRGFSPALSLVTNGSPSHSGVSRRPSETNASRINNAELSIVNTLASNPGSRFASNVASPAQVSPPIDNLINNSAGSSTHVAQDHNVDMMDVDPNPQGDGTTPEQKTEYKMLQFEGTKTWYERTKAARGGLMWEHLAVMSVEDWPSFSKWVSLVVRHPR
jgi:hypothetical protein